MMILYTLTYWFTGLIDWAFRRRVRSLEGRFVTAARSAERLAHELSRRPGNSNTQDPYVAAKGYYELGKLVDLRDRLETRYTKWQFRANRLSQRRERLRNWKGRYVPYLAGAADVALVAVVLQLTGVIDVPTIQAAEALVAQG